MAAYSGSATSSYVKGYTVTANYAGTVSRIALNKTRYVAIFEGDGPAVGIIPVEGDSGSGSDFQFNWAYPLVPLGMIAVAGGGIGTALFLKRRHEAEEGAE